MEKYDVELIQKYQAKDEVLANLYREHVELDTKVEELENKSYLSTEETYELNVLKKKKLKGRDQIELILKKYRAAERKYG